MKASNMNDPASEQVNVLKGCLAGKSLDQVVKLCLPTQGSIEVQHDQAHKEHHWHKHQTDETLVLISGSFEFEWCEGKVICGPGDLIELPRGVLHRSKAMKRGALYVIVPHRINLPI